MTELLDTSVCVAYLRGRTDDALRARIQASRRSDVCLCSIVEAELRFGVLRSKDPSRERIKLDQLLEQFDSLTFDSVSAERYAQVRLHLESHGVPIGDRDMMIASIALSHDLTVVTLNVDEFRRVPGLRVTDWQPPAGQ